MNRMVCLANVCYTNQNMVFTMSTNVQSKNNLALKYVNRGRKMTNEALYYAFLTRSL